MLQVPLEALSAELEAHLQVLRNRLVEVINEHYGDFVSLSSKLVNVDSAVIRMQKPLLEIKVHLPPSPPTLCLSSRPEPLLDNLACAIWNLCIQGAFSHILRATDGDVPNQGLIKDVQHAG